MGAKATTDRRTARRARSPRVGGRASARTSRPQPVHELSEAELEQQLVELARYYGWMIYHVHDSRRVDWRSDQGFPDWILLRGHDAIVLELKTRRGRVTAKQRKWLRAFADVRRVTAGVMRPDDPSDDLAELRRLLA